VRIVVFDLDGTLIDSNAIKRNAFFGLAKSDPGGGDRMARLLSTVSGDRHAIWAAYVRERDGEDAAPSAVFEAVQAYNAIVDNAVAAAPEMPGASDLLTRLRKAGLQLAVSSATPRENLTAILAMRGWLDWFDTVAGSPVNKAETLRVLTLKHRISADQLAVVGDGEDDRASAKTLGCAFYPVGEGRGTTPGDRIFTLFEVGEIIANHIAGAST
jgi:phosphoglycolate phosphatase-like HAD superfamily hydrolase